MIEVPNVPWNSLLGSGVKVSNDSEADLLSVWESHLEDVGRLGFRSPDELPGGETYPVGAAQRVEVNRYERDPRARAAALEAHGFDCIVCGFNFESAYGERGHEYVHVHHLVELSTLPEGSQPGGPAEGPGPGVRELPRHDPPETASTSARPTAGTACKSVGQTPGRPFVCGSERRIGSRRPASQRSWRGSASATVPHPRPVATCQRPPTSLRYTAARRNRSD